MSNPLIADGGSDTLGFTNFTTEDNKHLEGAGIFSDAAATMTDASQHNWVGLGVDVAADALDVLGLATDPFGVLVGAPIGWIIEHVGFLKEILDRVAGDPVAVRGRAQTWANVAAALDKSADDYTRSAHALADQFCGHAADSYIRAATNYTATVRGAAAHAKDASKGFEVAGTIVGTVRGAIRDMFAQFAADALWRGLVAWAASVETFGASVAAWTVSTVSSAISVGERAAAKILRAVRQVTDLVGGARGSSAALRRAEQDLLAGAGRRAAAINRANRAGRDIHAAGGKAEAAEEGIQRAKRAQDRAQEKIDNAANPADRTAAQNELHNAEARERAQRDNLNDARRDEVNGRDARRTAAHDSREAGKHELPDDSGAGSAADRLERTKNATERVNGTVRNTNDDRDSAEDNADEVDDGSLV